MRLAQLARKLKVKSSEISDFLVSKNIEVGHNSNTKFSDETVMLLVERFGDLEKWQSDINEEIRTLNSEVIATSETKPIDSVSTVTSTPSEPDTTIDEVIEAEVTVKEDVEEEDSTILATVTENTEPEPITVDNKDANESEFEKPDTFSIPEKEMALPPIASDDQIEVAHNIEEEDSLDPRFFEEVIKAPKVDLPGLKVLGKIDLPKPKPKEDKVIVDKKEKKKKGRKSREKREYDKDGNWINPLEVQRQRKKEREEKLRKQREEQLKERKTKHYLEKVKDNQTPSVPKRKKSTKQKSKVKEAKQNNVKKGLISRFLYWLNN